MALSAARLRRLLPAAVVSLAASGSVLGAVELDERLRKLVADLSSNDILDRHRAQVGIRNLGADSLEPLASILAAGEDRNLRLEGLFRENLEFFLEDFENEVVALDDDQVFADRTAAAIEERGEAAGAGAAERLENLRARIAERQPRVRERLESLERIGLPAFTDIVERMEIVDPRLVSVYGSVLEESIVTLGRDGLSPDPGSPAFDARRYLLSPLWLWIELTKNPLHAQVGGVLVTHLERTFTDLQSADTLTRERAEDELFMLRHRGLDLLRRKAERHPAVCERLVGLLEWRIHPRLRERTSMDFARYRSMGFRERREHVIRYARTAGRDGIPTLRLLVLDDEREPSVRVKLTAAEQLAGLRDNTGIVALTAKPVPELMRIPEISRDFFILQGVRYQNEKKYDLAIAEFRKILDESPFHFDANYRIAFVYLLDKQYKKSIHHFEIARKIRPDDHLTLYNLSCAYSLDGQIEKALDMLEASVHAGFTDAAHIKKDPDIDPLRETPRYRKLLEDLESGR